MRSFLIVWLVAFGLFTVVAAGVSWYVARSAPPPTAGQQPSSADPNDTPAAPFLEADAIDTVAMRLPFDAAGNEARQKLQSSAVVTYHSYQHWRVCFEDACWVAHGPGRYAEAENDAALRHESRAAPTR